MTLRALSLSMRRGVAGVAGKAEQLLLCLQQTLAAYRRYIMCVVTVGMA